MVNLLNLKEIQEKVDLWIKNHGGYWSPLSMMGAIMEEIGEVAREINSLEGFKPKKQGKNADLFEELGDLLFSIVCLANYYDVELNDAILKSMEKFSERDSNRFTK